MDNQVNGAADVAMLLAYPVPSDVEWNDILRPTAEYEDVHDAFACVGQYEIRLQKRGFKTLLGYVIGNLHQAANSIGVPDDRIPDVVTLLYLAKKSITTHLSPFKPASHSRAVRFSSNVFRSVPLLEFCQLEGEQ